MFLMPLIPSYMLVQSIVSSIREIDHATPSQIEHTFVEEIFVTIYSVVLKVAIGMQCGTQLNNKSSTSHDTSEYHGELPVPYYAHMREELRPW
jgi:hypothetical protein